ncbi:hypothetical protein BDV96DRAFT_631034 [Lophiotrema nucula]|uniref:Uncharacterized protein n=1 Tax=Lophiotrema nucula TaxID=690887 RepID=A0A6A5ZEF5_9PLEO|nr:hypothetical protein BDV96DRAFT_631034 [Lophiotrema nucula]
MAPSTSTPSIPTATVQTDHSDYERASVVTSPSWSSPAALKSPTPSFSSIFGRLRSPVVSSSYRTPAVTPSRVSSLTPSIGPAVHGGVNTCEEVDEICLENKAMTQQMNGVVMGLEKGLEESEERIEKLQAELKLKEDANTKYEGDRQQLEELYSSARNELDRCHKRIEELSGSGNREEFNNLKKGYEDKIARLQCSITDLEDKLAEMSDAALLDSQTIETMTEEITDLKESHKSEVTSLKEELAEAQYGSQRYRDRI